MGSYEEMLERCDRKDRPCSCRPNRWECPQCIFLLNAHTDLPIALEALRLACEYSDGMPAPDYWLNKVKEKLEGKE